MLNSGNYFVGFNDGVRRTKLNAAKKMLLDHSIDINTIIEILEVKATEREKFIKSLKSILV